MRIILAAGLLVLALPVRAGLVSDALQFAAGLAAGLAVHELGHIIVAHAYGEKLSLEGTTLECKWPCKHYDKVALAGNLSTALIGEALLHTDLRGSFIDGMQTWNTINPIQYHAADTRSRHGHYDYAAVDDRVQLALAIHAASIGYRHVAQGRWRVGTRLRTVTFSIDF